MKRYTIENLFECLLNKMLLAENEILDQLKLASQAAESQQLKEIFSKHMGETELQVERLKEAIKLIENKHKEAESMLEKGKELVKTIAKVPFINKSEAIDGIIKEGKAVFKEFGKTELHDLVLSSGTQAIEMGEIAAYKTLCRIAQECGYQETLGLLQKSLQEEESTYELLSEVTDQEVKRLKK